MLRLLDVLEEWAADRSAAGDGVSIEFKRGRLDRPNRSASVGFESSDRLGVVSVWEGGAVEAEVLVIESMERPLVVSVEAMFPVELRTLLDSVQGAMAGSA